MGPKNGLKIPLRQGYGREHRQEIGYARGLLFRTTSGAEQQAIAALEIKLKV